MRTISKSSLRAPHSGHVQFIGTSAQGVPGALSNQAPANAQAPIVNPPAQPGQPGTVNPQVAQQQQQQQANGQQQQQTVPTDDRHDATTNYELDRTISHTKAPVGVIKRMSVAVVVNYKREVDKSGKVTMRPLSEDEKTQITNLVKEAMGYSKDRGDTLNVVNTSFAGADSAADNAPWWQKILDGILANWWEILKAAAKWLVFAIVFLYCYRNFIKPALNKAKETVNPTPAAHEHG